MAATATLVTLDLEDALADLDLNDTIEKFKSERIDLDNFFKSHSTVINPIRSKDNRRQVAVDRKGRIGDYKKKRNACKPVDRNETLASQIIQQRNTLFNRNRNGRGQKRPCDLDCYLYAKNSFFKLSPYLLNCER